jgi:hypothetical protein
LAYPLEKNQPFIVEVFEHLHRNCKVPQDLFLLFFFFSKAKGIRYESKCGKILSECSIRYSKKVFPYG